MRMATEKKNEKIVSVRMNEEDFKYLKAAAFTIGMTPSRFLRMLADSSINGIKIKVKQGQLKIEDIESICND